LGLVVAHFMRVNKCGKGGFASARGVAFDIYKQRSNYAWTVDISSISEKR